MNVIHNARHPWRPDTNRLVRLVLITMLLLVTAACSGLGGEPRIVATIPPQPGNIDAASSDADIAALMTAGGVVWMDNCAECHGRTGLGTTSGAPLPDLTSYSEEQILASITNGITDPATGQQRMPAFGETLSPEQLQAAGTYARMMSLAIARGMVNPDAEGGDSVAQAQPTSAAAEVPAVVGVVSGQVTNGTAGASAPATLPLTLHVVKSEFAEERFEAVTTADGTYRIEGVPFDAAYQYVLTAPYGDLQYVSEIVRVDPTTPELVLPMPIYEVGAPVDAIQINAISAQTLVQGDTLQVIQIASFVNTSDRVYFNRNVEDGTSVWLRLPQGATLLSSMNEQYIPSADGTQLYSISPLMPGRTSAMHVAFALPYNPNVTTVEQVIDFPLAGEIDITVASEGVGLTGEGFAPAAAETASGRDATTYLAQVTTAAGATLRYELAGVPVAPPPPPSTTDSAAGISPLAYVLIGAGISALLIAGILFIRERMTAKPGGAPVIGDLMEKIAALDTQHQAGKLNKREYEQQRSALKAQLSVLMKEQ